MPIDKREEWIDFLKGIAIISMIAGHVLGGLEVAEKNCVWGMQLRNFFYAFHMPMMFICSGYLAGKTSLSEKGKPFGSYVLKNVISLYIPYLWSIYLWWAIKFFIYRGNEEVSLNEIVTNLYSGRSSFWFLLALLLVKILHGFFEYYKLKYHALVFALIFLVAVISYVVSGDMPELLNWLSYGLYYNLGYFSCKKNGIEFIKHKKIISIVGAMCFVMLGIILPGVKNCIYKKFFTSIGLTVLFGILAIKSKRNYKGIEYIGKQSMVFYLISLFVTPLSRVLLMKMNLKSIEIHFILGTLGALFIPFLCIKLYENVRCFSWVKSLFYPGQICKGKIN